MEPKRRRTPRQPTAYVMDMSQPIQHTSPDAAWVKTQIVEATVKELSKVSVADVATVIRAAVKGQPIDVAPVARLAMLGLLNLGLVVYDYLAPPSDPLHYAGSVRHSPEEYGHRGRICPSPRDTQAFHRRGGRGGCVLRARA
jgi:hypothetical protein